MDLHETRSACDHDVLDVWQRLEFRGPREDWGLLPDAKVLKEVLASAVDACTGLSVLVQAGAASRFTYHLSCHWYR